LSPLEAALWPLERLPEAVEALAVRARTRQRARDLPRAPQAHDVGSIGRWMEAAAAGVGLEAEPVGASYPETRAMVRGLGPGIAMVPGATLPRFAVALGARYGRLRLLAPDQSTAHVAVSELSRALCESVEKAALPEVERLLDRSGVRGASRDRTQAALLNLRLQQSRTEGAWVLRLPPGAQPSLQIGSVRLLRRLALLLALQFAEYSLWLLSWVVIGLGALRGRLDPGWMLAWALLRLTLVPLRMAATQVGGTIAIDAALQLKSRLLAGALRLLPEEIRREGVGQLLGRVLESEAVETVGITGALAGLSGLIELMLSAVVLGLGAGGGLQVLLLCGWCALAAALALRFHRIRAAWTEARLELTHDQVERMNGHRTRQAQEPPGERHSEEDQALDRYLELSRRMDNAWLPFAAGIPRGWTVVGLVALLPPILARVEPSAIALSVLGVMLAFRALQKLGGALAQLSGAALSAKQVAPLFTAAARMETLTSPELVDGPAQAAAQGTLLDAQELTFRHNGRAEPVLEHASLRLRDGDRVLLQGPTGSGKSTLASILCGLRTPDSGLLLLRGLDQRSLGATGWRRRVACAPQFHENYVLTGTFAFNLLMGRDWPPRLEDMREAEAICRELQLGPLLERMPAGLLQMVGETGWQLSHGEKSRLYVARALLQRADVVVLDESFAALDPETLRQAVRCVLKRARTVLVIAHP
jgi:ATP-binding cassette subfamily B protein